MTPYPDVIQPLDGHTLLARLRALGEVGAGPAGEGRTRLALSEADKAGRDLLVAWMREAGLNVQIDAIGNIFGRLAPSQREAAARAPLMIGSHIDTVKNAGALDGCYGVLAGLAVATALRRAADALPRPLVVAAFTNEEGVRYQPDMMGSLVFAGGMRLAQALATVGTDGSQLGEALARIGYAGDEMPGAWRPHEYLELHIEQGPILEAEGLPIAAVERVQGISWQRLSFQGEANHAGTTPMRLRRDAGVAAAATIAFLHTLAQDSGTTLATVGSLRLQPDAINIIPRQAVMTVDLRDPDASRLRAAEQRLADFLVELAARQGVRIDTETLARLEPVDFAPHLVAAIECAADALGLAHRRMTSGAGHDAQMIARIAPAAMIFVPSRGGISHDPREHTDEDALLAGARVLLATACDRLWGAVPC